MGRLEVESWTASDDAGHGDGDGDGQPGKKRMCGSRGNRGTRANQ